MSEHTPGPWIAIGTWVEHPDDNTPDICNCDPFSMAQEGRSDEEVCANARLIAAAPEMLKALRALTDKGRVPPTQKAFWDARYAIAKAQGVSV